MRRMFFAALIIGVMLSTFSVSAAEITIGTGTSTWNYPLSASYHDARTQTIYLASEIGEAKTLTYLALHVTTTSGQYLNNFVIRLKHTDLSSYSASPVWESSNWTTVYQASRRISTAGWTMFVFSTPFIYNGTQNLMVDISFYNSYGSSDRYCQYTPASVNRSICFRTNSGYGDPLTWTNRTPTPGVSVNFPNIRLSDETAIAVPNLEGMAKQTAQNVIIETGFTVGNITKALSDSIPTGFIVSQSPAAGTATDFGSEVDLVVSLGPGIPVPNVEGMSQWEANSAILSAGLSVGTVSTVYNPSVPAGQVLEQSPVGGTLLSYSSPIDLVISRNAYGTGSGTPADPYQIQTKADVLALGNTPSDHDKCFILTADIDMQGEVFTRAVIATGGPYDSDPEGAFTGTFDGNGHKITNFIINGGNRANLGLFGRIYSPYSGGGSVNENIRNLGVENCVINGLSNSSQVGGLVGYIDGGGITGCYAFAIVNGNWRVGGLAGYNYHGRISHCYSTGSVNGVSNSEYFSSTIGGLVGCIDGGSTLTACYSTSAVTGVEKVAGLVGSNKDGTVSYSYSAGLVNGISEAYGLIGGGGSNDCFWDVQTTGQTVGYSGEGKTTAEMQDKATFVNADWDFTDTDGDPADWYMPSGYYPQLSGFSSVSFPNVVGMPLANAQSTIESAGLAVGAITKTFSATVPAGSIVNQSPAEGVLVNAGSAVSLVVSLGCYSGGDGSAADPYQIATKDNLLLLAASPDDYDKCFILTADIDMGGQVFTQAIIAPDINYINYYFDGTPFRGILDGCGHKITNFTINGGTNDYLGFFGATGSGSQIKNLGLENFSVVGSYILYSQGSSCVGGLVALNGYEESGIMNLDSNITQCYTTGTVYGMSRVGGLVGINDYGGIISQCYSTGAVSGVTEEEGGDIGGLVGGNEGNIIDCYSTGLVSGYGTIGGLTGYTYSVTNSFWDIETSGVATSGGGTGKTTAQMQTLSTFTSAGWDFINGTDDDLDHTWFIREGQDYPRLLWEIENGQSGLFPQGFVTISKTRVSRTSFEYELAVTVHNSNTFDMTNVQMQLMDWDTAVQSVLDDFIIIDTIPSKTTVTSTDTFKIVVDRSRSIVSSRLTWVLTYYAAASGDQVQEAMMSMPLSALDAIAGDITGDGNVNLDDFAVLAWQWNTTPGTPSADIALPLDKYVGIEDLIYLVENWLN